MRRTFPFFACLMLVLTLWAGTAAHAAETLLPVEEATAMIWGHSAGDADEVPADDDKAIPHHHGLCHGHDVNMPREFIGPARIAVAMIEGFRPVRVLGSTQTDTALRPPNA